MLKPSLRRSSMSSVKYNVRSYVKGCAVLKKKKHEIPPLDDNDNVDNENNLDILECTCNVNP